MILNVLLILTCLTRIVTKARVVCENQHCTVYHFTLESGLYSFRGAVETEE